MVSVTYFNREAQNWWIYEVEYPEDDIDRPFHGEFCVIHPSGEVHVGKDVTQGEAHLLLAAFLETAWPSNS